MFGDKVIEQMQNEFSASGGYLELSASAAVTKLGQHQHQHGGSRIEHFDSADSIFLV